MGISRSNYSPKEMKIKFFMELNRAISKELNPHTKVVIEKTLHLKSVQI